MNVSIENICSNLMATADSLKKDAEFGINQILLASKVEQSNQSPSETAHVHISNQERPWMITGGIALTVGVLGCVFSKGVWPYVIAGAGVASLAYGQTKKNKLGRNDSNKHEQPISGLQGYEVADKAIQISKSIESQWKAKVEVCKVAVQKVITNAAIPQELKDCLMTQTYTTERISIDFDNIVSRLESESADHYTAILYDFRTIVLRSIDSSVTAQISTYRNISQQL